MIETRSHLPSTLSVLVTIAAISSLLCLSSAATSAAKDDAAVMAKLAKSLSPTPSSWSGDPCGWSGVSCDGSGHVTSISLVSRSIGGELPSDLNLLSHLKSLSLQRNRLSGSLPSLSNLASLQQAFLDSNNFDSIPSPFLTGLTSLQTLSISDNPLPPWMIPETLADSTTLTTLFLGNTSLVGSMPDIFGSFPSLQNVRLSYNNLTGPLPPSLAKSAIQTLWLNNQQMGLSGTLQVLSEMPQLTQVWLHGNHFSGSIPDLSECTSLFDLSLRDNDLTGPVPSSLSMLQKLANVSLQNNKLQGPVPGFPRGVQVNLGNTNNFCNSNPGPCDPQVTSLLEIAGAFGYPMDLAESWGCLGTISPAIADLTELTTVMLNDNNLTGTIPMELTKLAHLRLLDLSNNNISGVVPTFRSGVIVNLSGNPLIGQNVTTGDGNSPSNSSHGGRSGGSSGDSSGGTAVAGTPHKSSASPWVIVTIITVAVIVIAALSLVIYKRFVKKRSRKTQRFGGKLKKGGGNSEFPSQTSVDQSDTQVHDGVNIAIPIELLREVTHNFSECNILGRGGFGVVYRGQLHDGTQIAVKRMEAAVSSSKGLSEFQAEIAVLSKVRHRHLVALIGFCVHGNERLLVYEYMPQGTLAQHLFYYRELGIVPLTWKQRVAIGLDVARGIEYLHSLAQQSFIHRDLKPSNILLGDDMRAKVSDFGLVKNAPDGKSSVETRLAGTFGYLAPEYAGKYKLMITNLFQSCSTAQSALIILFFICTDLATGRVTTKIDVFAFGIVLMEMITGRKALDESLPEEKSHLVTWFRRLLNNKDSIRQSLDPTLEPLDEETFESICKVAELAGHCTAREPHQRPDMGHSVTVLSPLVAQWKPTSRNSRDEDDSFGIDFSMSLPQALQHWQSGEGTTIMATDIYNGYTSTSMPPGHSEAITFNSTDGR
ncbi:leucine-rich repeat protein kinase family protein [Actinidia rufa]|uniref:Leucine-rich repeat protein kinase family protein n=1 Tax=Actinidia rufa TaxID=165716 RepID=A0A7J0GRA7_9ERIC|nr:leucine-rich repeat protein kinase family protein [Actinidia rufa]